MQQRRSGEDCLHMLTDKFSFIFEQKLIEEICLSGKLGNFSAGDMLIDLRQNIEYIPLILSGSIKIMTEDKEGNELLLYYLELGDTCAVTLNCCSKETSSTIRATCETDCQLVFVPAEKLEEWMVKFKSWRNFILQSYHERLGEMLKAVDTLAFENMEERLYKYLKNKVLVNANPDLHVTHLEIANDLHSSRVVISRLMKKLEMEGKIRQHRNRIEFLDLIP
ncbi:MAG: Crp/Fnr family transcriptional regulator [Bacteroidota bacterium]